MGRNLNRRDVIEQLMRCLVLTNRPFRIAVCLNNSIEVKEFSKDLSLELDKIPSYLQPNIVRVTRHGLETDLTRINIISSVNSMRGATFSMIYMSGNLSVSKKEEYSMYGLAVALATGVKITYFENE